MNQQEALLKAQKVFANHDVDTLFITSDMQAFFAFDQASLHAKNTIGDDEVKTVTKGDVADLEVSPDAELEKKQKATEKVELIKSNLIAKQEAFDAETDETKLDELSEELKKFGEELEDAEKALAELE